jgi:uncharacterized protein (TIGR03437 family)
MRALALLLTLLAAGVMPAAAPGSKGRGLRAAGQEPRAVTPLTSGVEATYSLPAVTNATLFYGDYGFSIVVPTGATQLRVEINGPANADVDLYVRRGADVDLQGGELIADYLSEGLTSSETITISLPPPGTYYIAFGLYTTGIPVSGRVRATVTGGGTGGGGTGGTPTVTSISLDGGSYSGTFASNGQFWDTIPGNARAWLGVSAPGVTSPLLNAANKAVNIPPGTYYTYNEPTFFGTAVRITVTWSDGRPSDSAIFQVGSLTTPTSFARLTGSATLSLSSTGLTNVNRVTNVSFNPGLQNDNVLQLTIGAPASGGGTSGSLVNGGFELPGTIASYENMGTGSTRLVGWQITAGDLDYIGTLWAHPQGKASLDMNGVTPATIAQTFTTVPGTSYTVAFDLAGNSGGGPTLKQIRSAAAGQSRDFQFDVTGRSASNMGWSRQSWSFTANSTSTTLTFQSLISGAYGPALDNVVVTAGGSGGGGGTGGTGGPTGPLTGSCTPAAGGTGSYTLNRIEVTRTSPDPNLRTVPPSLGAPSETLPVSACQFPFGFDYLWGTPATNRNRVAGLVTFTRAPLRVDPGSVADFAARMNGEWIASGYGVDRDHTIRLEGAAGTNEYSNIGSPNGTQTGQFTTSALPVVPSAVGSEITMRLNATVRFGGDHIATMEVRLIYTGSGGGTGGGTSPNLLTNGSFEQPATQSTFDYLPTGSTRMPGWRVATGDVEHIGNYWRASEGVQSIDLNGVVPGSIVQTFATVAGTAYTVSFDLAGNSAGGFPLTKSMRVSAAGSQSPIFTFDATNSTSANMGWRRQTWSFTANSSSTNLTFESVTPGTAWGPAIDNVVVTAGGSGGGTGGGGSGPTGPMTGTCTPASGGTGSYTLNRIEVTRTSPQAGYRTVPPSLGAPSETLGTSACQFPLGIDFLWGDPPPGPNRNRTAALVTLTRAPLRVDPGSIADFAAAMNGEWITSGYGIDRDHTIRLEGAAGTNQYSNIGAPSSTQTGQLTTSALPVVPAAVGTEVTMRLNATVRFGDDHVMTMEVRLIYTGTGGGGGGGTGSNLLTNGGFELPGNNGSYVTLSAGSSGLTGWSITSGDVDYVGTFWTPSEGRSSLDMDGFSAGTIAQTFSTIAGTTYTVAFDLAGNAAGGPAIKTIRSSAAGQSRDFTFDTTGRSNTNMGWTRQSWSFTANSSSTTLSFQSLTAGSAGPALDNVVVTSGTGTGGGGTGGGGTGGGTTPGCNYFVPPSSNVSGGGGTGLINVITGPACDWTAVSNASWITIEAGRTGRGNGAVSYRATANPDAQQRTGTITVAGQTHTVVQGAGTPCTYSISVDPPLVSGSGGTGAIVLTTGPTCVWTASSNAFWLTVTPTSGTGSRTLQWTAAANVSATARTGAISFTGGRTFTVNQAPATASGGPNVSPGGVVGAASGIPPSLPGGALALGSFFSVFAEGVGPNPPEQANSFPLPTNLGGTTVRIRQGSTGVDAFLVFSSPSQINGIIPSNAPLGDAEMIISYNGRSSAPVRIRTVRNNFGIFSVGGGRGPGIIQNFISPTDQPLNTRSASGRPGQVITLWGTGGGPISAPDNLAPPVGDLPYDFEMQIGGKRARLLYNGRAPCCSGVDQIVAEIPNDVPLGCSVPVQVRAGDLWSNTVTMAISQDGSPCSDPTNPLSSLPQAGGRTGTIALVRLGASLSTTDGTQSLTADLGMGVFSESAPGGELGFSPLTSLPPQGSCQAYTSTQDFSTLLTGVLPGGLVGGTKMLNAGPSITITPPGGRALPLERGSDGTYIGLLGGGIPGLGSTPLVLNAGTFQIAGPGGADVGSFQTSVTLGSSVAWANREQLSILDRRQSFDVTWTGGGADQRVLIAGIASDQANKASGLFMCLAPASAGRFTVPTSAMSNMPSAPGLADFSQRFGILVVAALRSGNFPTFTAPGIASGIIVPASIEMRTVEVR